VAATGDIYAGLWYPIGIAVMTLVIGAIFLKDTKGVDISTSSGVKNQTA
jgi:preprotein translocase subunit SecG